MSKAARHLREHQEQLDPVGLMVGVSREALNEVLTELDVVQNKYNALLMAWGNVVKIADALEEEADDRQP